MFRDKNTYIEISSEQELQIHLLPSEVHGWNVGFPGKRRVCLQPIACFIYLLCSNIGILYAIFMTEWS